ncbi:MAG: hypothetical protein F6K30_09590 [Cyanothece sp. SIO2G6]|nr:hypothetical protein [Cyanothece sp. SIO2G6]
MDQLIISIILGVLAAILLSRLLKGVLRITAIFIVSVTLVVVSATISGSSSSWTFWPSWLNSRTSSPVVDDPGSSADNSSPSLPAATPESIPAETPEATTSQATVPLFDSAFIGATAGVGSDQDPSTAELLADIVAPSDASRDLPPENASRDLPSEDASGRSQSGSPVNSSPTPNPPSRPINALW